MRIKIANSLYFNDSQVHRRQQTRRA
jgi:hypothetical protein